MIQFEWMKWTVGISTYGNATDSGMAYTMGSNHVWIVLKLKLFLAKKKFQFLRRVQTLAKLKYCQNCTFEPLHEIQKFWGPKAFFWSIMKVAFDKNIHKISQGPPNPWFRSAKVQNEDFLKTNLVRFDFFFVLGSYEFLECLKG